MPAPYSFRGAWAAIRVFNPSISKSQRFDVGALRSDGDYLPYFSQMRLKRGLAANVECSVDLAIPTYEEFIKIIESPWCRIYNTLSVRWGYVDDPSHVSPEFHCFMQKPEVKIDGAQYSITLVGTGFAWPMQRAGTQKVWASEDQPRTLLAVIREICRPYGMDVAYPSKLPQYADEALNKPRTSLVQSGINDWAWVRRELYLVGLHCFIDKGHVFRIYFPSNLDAPKTTFTPVGTIAPSEGIFPLWNFDVDMSPFFLAGKGVALSSMGMDAPRKPDAKLPDATAASRYVQAQWNQMRDFYGRNTIDTSKLGTTMTTGRDDFKASTPDIPTHPDTGGVFASVKNSGQTFSEMMPVASQDETAYIQMTARADLNIQKVGSQFTFDSFDDPTLTPGDLVAVKNMGAPFSGNANVIEIETTVGSDFGMMTVVCGQLGTHGQFENDGVVEQAAHAETKDAQPGDKLVVEADPGAGLE